MTKVDSGRSRKQPRNVSPGHFWSETEPTDWVNPTADPGHVERRIAAIENRQQEASLEKAGVRSSKRHASDSPIEIKIPEGDKRSEYMQSPPR